VYTAQDGTHTCLARALPLSDIPRLPFKDIDEFEGNTKFPKSKNVEEAVSQSFGQQ
jgi:hypothetical protein